MQGVKGCKDMSQEATYKLVQFNFFNKPVPACPFCAFPISIRNFRCEYELAKSLPDFNPFKVDWHIDLEAEERLHLTWAPKIAEILNEVLKERTEIQTRIVQDRVSSWVESKVIKARKKARQISITCYLAKEIEP